MSYDIQEAIKTQNWQSLPAEERQALIDSELDAYIEQAITDGYFNIINGRMTLEAANNSILSTMTTAELNTYLANRRWQISKQVRVFYEVKIPTFMYTINFPGQVNKQVQFYIDATTLVDIGTTDSSGHLSVNLSEAALQVNTHPLLMGSQFKFKIDNTEWQFDKNDTNYQYLSVTATKTVGKKW